MTDQQFAEMIKLLRSIDGNLANIKKLMPDEIDAKLFDLGKKLGEISDSIDSLEVTVSSKD
jgi:hypothetical protein